MSISKHYYHIRHISCRATITCLTVLFSYSCGVASAAEFIPLGFLPGDAFSRAAGVSDDGMVVSGTSAEANFLGDEITSTREAFRWSQATGLVGIGTLPGDGFSFAGVEGGDPAISADGSTIVGYSATSLTDVDGFVQMNSSSIAPLGDTGTQASAASLDGSVIVGSANGEAFRWTESEGVVGLGVLNEALISRAHDVSDGGSIVVGASGVDKGSERWSETFRWSSTTGIVGLGVRSTQSGARPSISSNGDVITSDGFVSSNEYVEAFRWTEETGAVGLGWLPGTQLGDGSWLSLPRGINDDGSVIVGFSGTSSFTSDDPVLPFIWTEESGMQNLQDVLIDQHGLGTSLQGWKLGWPQDISANGRFIVGVGRNAAGNIEGWLVRLNPVPEPSSGLLAALSLLIVPLTHRVHGRRKSVCR